MDQDRRHNLQGVLETVLGSRNVYFQPPSTVKMQYPCIVYRRYEIDEKRANNQLYLYKQRYQLIVIDQDPDSPILFRVRSLPLCSFDRHYTVNNLNHDAFNIYY